MQKLKFSETPRENSESKFPLENISEFTSNDEQELSATIQKQVEKPSTKDYCYLEMEKRVNDYLDILGVHPIDPKDKIHNHFDNVKTNIIMNRRK